MLKLFLLLVSIASLSVATPETGDRRVFRVGTRRRLSQEQQLIRQGRFEELAATRKQHTISQADGQAVHQQPIRDYRDSLYVGDVKLGTPPQTFSLQINTGAADLWVIDTVCDKAYEEDCKGQRSSGYSKRRFDAKASSTFKNSSLPFLETYDFVSAAGGTIGYDVIDLAGITEASQAFGVAQRITADFGLQQIDGVLGLGWPALAGDNLTSPLWNMLDQLDQPIFTVFMARNQMQLDTTTAMDGGRISFGGLDNEKCDSQINYVALNSNEYWKVKMDHFSVGNYQGRTTYKDVIFDTSTPFIEGPPDEITAIRSQTGALLDSKLQLYTLNCKGKKPDLVFKINGIEYRVPASEYVLDYGLSDGKCVLAVTGSNQFPGQQTWLMGAPIMRQYCIVHDIGKARIGLALSVNESRSTSVILLLAASVISRLMF